MDLKYAALQLTIKALDKNLITDNADDTKNAEAIANFYLHIYRIIAHDEIENNRPKLLNHPAQ